MPILREEVSVYPESLLEASPSEEDQNWYVVYTRARHEKSLARHMYTNEMSFYLPLVSKEQFSHGRRTRSYLPVFSGYLFYFGDAVDEVRKLAPYCVSCVFPVEDQTRLRQELRDVQRLLSTGSGMTVESRLVPGKKVRVKSGPLKGLEGTIVQRRTGNRLLVSVQYLQQGVSVEIEDFMVEAF